MTQERSARLHRAKHYDGTNGADVVAEIPGASLNSGGTGNTTLVIDITDAGQHAVVPDRYIVWTEYPSAPVNVLDIISPAAYEQVYGGLCDCAAVTAALADIGEALDSLTGAPLVQAVEGITDANGNVSLTWPQAFSASPVVALAIQTTVAEVHTTRITARSSSGASIHVARSPIVAVLGVNVTAAMVNASGVTVHAVAVGAP
jgi:hypothetical protein